MTATKHTPGPWRVDRRVGHVYSRGVRDDGGESYVDVCRAENARLIAAAPDLLAACKAALDYIGAQSAGETQDQLRAAIAAAEGE